MNLIELFLLAVGLSMDAFAVSVCAGLTMTEASFRKMLIADLYFGIFQAGMPLIGYLAAWRLIFVFIFDSPFIIPVEMFSSPSVSSERNSDTFAMETLQRLFKRNTKAFTFPL